MHKRVRRKKIRHMIFAAVFLTGIIGVIGFLTFDKAHTFSDHAGQVTFMIIDDGRVATLKSENVRTVEDALKVYDPSIDENAWIFPPRDKRVFVDDVIVIERGKKITVSVDEQKIDLYTHRDTLEKVLSRENIAFTKDDIVKPHKDTVINTDVNVEIIRVEYREEVKIEKIAYKIIEKNDDELSFRKKIVEQAGENGEKTLTYRVAYHDGEEVDRELINVEITKEPRDEIVMQGTYVKLGKKHTGGCSWYAHTGTLAAANPWLPMGSYVKVTNQANGKSVIVKINDRGPFVPGRIIDLDKVAFKQIASLGAGVIDVTMEEIVN